jgi:Major Facilitator Superfamily
VRIPPTCTAFTLLMGFLVALPSFGIDMSLPALSATGASLHVAPAKAGLMMSVFMIGFAVAPVLYGSASDRYGRKPVVICTCPLFIVARVRCAMARSLSELLAWRLVQGAGAGASMTIAFAIIRDLFDGEAARTKVSAGRRRRRRCRRLSSDGDGSHCQPIGGDVLRRAFGAPNDCAHGPLLAACPGVVFAARAARIFCDRLVFGAG